MKLLTNFLSFFTASPFKGERGGLLLLLALLALPLSADQLTVEQSIARLSRQTGTRHLMPQKQGSLTLAATYGDPGENHFYVLNRPGDAGFLILGADDAAPALLADVEQGHFAPDSIAPSLRWWLNEYDRAINNSIALDRPLYSSTQRPAKSALTPLVKTTWGQGDANYGYEQHYNIFCPKIKGQNTSVGCVACAMAQIMNYYQWPKKGNGKVSYTTLTNKLAVSADFSQATYDWAAMQDHYGYTVLSNGSTATYDFDQAANDAVSLLMFHCGAATDMDYGLPSSGGSGTSGYYIAGALAKTFGYDPAVFHEQRYFYTDADWEDLVYNEIAAGRPVLYTGATEKLEGHAFVCDGYKNGLFHINWGWNGLSDGYYAITGTSCLHPKQQGTGGSYNCDAFVKDHVIITGIQRPQEGSKPRQYVGSAGSTIIFEPFFGTDYKNGTYFQLACEEGLYNFSYDDLSLKFGAKFVSTVSGKTFYIDYNDTYQTLGTLDGVTSFIVLGKNVPDGMYNVYPAFMVKGGEWQDVAMPAGSTPPTVKYGTGIETDPDNPTPIETEPQLACKSVESTDGGNDDRTVNITVTYPANIENTRFSGEVTLGLADPEGNIVAIFADRATPLSMTPSSYSEVPLRLSAVIPDSIADGNYLAVPFARQESATEWAAFYRFDPSTGKIYKANPFLSVWISGKHVSLKQEAPTVADDAILVCYAVQSADGGNRLRTLNLSLTYPGNGSKNDFNGQVAIGLCDAEGNILDIYEEQSADFQIASAKYTAQPLRLSAVLPATVADGHYLAVPFAFQEGSTNWTPFRYLDISTGKIESRNPYLDFWLQAGDILLDDPLTGIRGQQTTDSRQQTIFYDLTGRPVKTSHQGGSEGAFTSQRGITLTPGGKKLLVR